jgi:hypothetical protein
MRTGGQVARPEEIKHAFKISVVVPEKKRSFWRPRQRCYKDNIKIIFGKYV